MGTESEAAAAVVFLLSPAASYITGINLPVDGASSLTCAGTYGTETLFNPKTSLMKPYIGWLQQQEGGGEEEETKGQPA
ncbi:hypothetical protein BX616_009481, partial [Lobosporangium transversale]